MTKKILLLGGFSILLVACGENRSEASSENSEPTPEQASTKAIDEDQIILGLSAFLIAEPENKLEEDQNTLVNYAIDELIPLKRTRTGLFYHILDQGEGENLNWGDYISVHYKGYFLDGKVFDDTRRRDKPLQFYIGNMIPAWNEGLQLIATGGRIHFYVSSPLAYGEQGLKNSKGGFLVPPDVPLVFEVEVLERLKKAGE